MFAALTPGGVTIRLVDETALPYDVNTSIGPEPLDGTVIVACELLSDVMVAGVLPTEIVVPGTSFRLLPTIVTDELGAAASGEKFVMSGLRTI